MCWVTWVVVFFYKLNRENIFMIEVAHVLTIWEMCNILIEISVERKRLEWLRYEKYVQHNVGFQCVKWIDMCVLDPEL